MGTALKAGIGLAVIVEVFTIVWLLAGLHENPLMGILFIVIAIVLNVLAVLWALKKTAAMNGYGAQLAGGLVLGIVAGVLIFALSMLNLTVLFPDAMDAQKAGAIEWIENSGLPEDQLETQIEAIEAQTPVSSAAPGGIFTVITSLVAAAIIGIWVRRK